MKRLARALTRLYPASWRQRYGEEFEALLEQCPANPRMVVNAGAGAVGAWLRWPAAAAPRAGPGSLDIGHRHAFTLTGVFT